MITNRSGLLAGISSFLFIASELFSELSVLVSRRSHLSQSLTAWIVGLGEIQSETVEIAKPAKGVRHVTRIKLSSLGRPGRHPGN